MASGCFCIQLWTERYHRLGYQGRAAYYGLHWPVVRFLTTYRLFLKRDVQVQILSPIAPQTGSRHGKSKPSPVVLHNSIVLSKCKDG